MWMHFWCAGLYLVWTSSYNGTLLKKIASLDRSLPLDCNWITGKEWSKYQFLFLFFNCPFPLPIPIPIPLPFLSPPFLSSPLPSFPLSSLPFLSPPFHSPPLSHPQEDAGPDHDVPHMFALWGASCGPQEATARSHIQDAGTGDPHSIMKNWLREDRAGLQALARTCFLKVSSQSIGSSLTTEAVCFFFLFVFFHWWVLWVSHFLGNAMGSLKLWAGFLDVSAMTEHGYIARLLVIIVFL